MKKRTRTILTTAFALCALILASCGQGASELRMGTAGSGGVYAVLGSALADAISRADNNVIVEAGTTSGSAANLRLLSEGQLQLAIVQYDLAADAYYAINSYDGKDANTSFTVIAPLYSELCHIIVLKDSGITRISDLKGRSVSIGEYESGTEANAKSILGTCGINETNTGLINMNYSQAGKSLGSGDIDAMFVTIGTGAEVIQTLSEKNDIAFISLGNDEIGSLIGGSGYYSRASIPAGTYSGQDEAIQTISVTSILAAHKDLSEEDAYAVTAAWYDSIDSLRSISALSSIDGYTEADLEKITIPFHTGAEKWYKENE